MTQVPEPSSSGPEADPLKRKLRDALSARVTNLREYVQDTQSGEVLKARLASWTTTTAATLRAFGLPDAARDLALIRGERDILGDEYLDSRADALVEFLISTLRHVASGTFTLVDPDASPEPTSRFGPRQLTTRRLHVVAVVPPRGSHVRSTPRTPPPPTPAEPMRSHVQVHQHFGDVIGGDKNVNEGPGSIVTHRGGHERGSGRAREPAAHDPPAPPTSATEALATIVAPRGAGPVRRTLWRVLLIVGGVVAFAIATLVTVLPESTKQDLWTWIKSWV